MLYLPDIFYGLDVDMGRFGLFFWTLGLLGHGIFCGFLISGLALDPSILHGIAVQKASFLFAAVSLQACL